MYYYHIEVAIKNQPGVLKGVREFEICDDHQIYNTVRERALKRFKKEDIIKIDVWLLAPWNTEVEQYLAKKYKQEAPGQ